MDKSKIILLATGGVVGLIIIVMGIFTVSSMNTEAESAKELKEVVQKYKNINKAKPYPNKDNLKQLEKNLEIAETNSRKLIEQIQEGGYVINSKQGTPGFFGNERSEMISRLTENAPESSDGTSVAVAGLTFGFDKYKEDIPDGKNVSRLMQQLTMIEQLVNILYKAEIDKLQAVRREEFEDVVSAEEEEEEEYTSRRSSRRSRGRSSSSSGVVNSGGPVKIEPFEQGVVETDRQRFEFEFLATQDSLSKVLNSIVQMKPYALVSKLSFEKADGKTDYTPPETEKKEDEGKGRSRRNVREQSPEELLANATYNFSRTSRLVSGRLREAPIKVKMAVDVFTFISDQNEEAMEDNFDEDSDDFDENMASEEEILNDSDESYDEF